MQCEVDNVKGEIRERLLSVDSQEEEPTEKDDGYVHWKAWGVPMIVCSALFYSLSSLTVKLMSEINATEFLMFRFLGLFLFTLPLTLYHRQTLFPRDAKDFVALNCHSLSGAAVGFSSFYAIRHLPLGDASTLCFSTPLFVLALSVIFTKEKCCLFSWFVASLSFLGIVLVSKPEALFGSNRSTQTLGLISAVASAFFRANSLISLKFCKRLHYSVVICHFGAVGLLASMIYLFVSHKFCVPSRILDRLLLLAMSLLGFFGQILLTVSSKIESPQTLSVCRSTDILFAFLFQTTIFHQNPDPLSILGSIFIVISVCIIKVKQQDVVVSLLKIQKYKLRI